METEHIANSPITNPNKYRRALPILGLLFYYLGGLIVSLDVNENIVFMLQIVLFSVILFIGLVLTNKIAIILGAILVIVGALGPMVNFLLSLQDGVCC